MTTLRKRLALSAAALSLVTVMAGPAHAAVDGNAVATGVHGTLLATESGDSGAEDGERDKIQLPESSHHRVGLILLGASGIIGLLVLDNVRRRLKGEGEKATGEFRWR